MEYLEKVDKRALKPETSPKGDGQGGREKGGIKS